MRDGQIDHTLRLLADRRIELSWRPDPLCFSLLQADLSNQIQNLRMSLKRPEPGIHFQIDQLERTLFIRTLQSLQGRAFVAQGQVDWNQVHARDVTAFREDLQLLKEVQGLVAPPHDAVGVREGGQRHRILVAGLQAGLQGNLCFVKLLLLDASPTQEELPHPKARIQFHSLPTLLDGFAIAASQLERQADAGGDADRQRIHFPGVLQFQQRLIMPAQRTETVDGVPLVSGSVIGI